MGKGLAKRRRQQLAKAANFNNLHKAALGKASPNPQLPKAPDAKDLVEKMPASLRKILALKDAVAKQDQLKAKKAAQAQAKQQQQQWQAGADATASNGARQASGHHASTSGGDGNQAGHQKHKAGSAHDQAQQQGAGQQQSAAGGKAGKGGKGKGGAAGGDEGQGQAGAAAAAAAARQEEKIYVANAFDKPVKKGLKDKKKEYLKRKDLKKKGKMGDEGMSAAERKLALQQVATKAKFGEVADAPLEVHLKRKHWVGQEGAEGQGQGQGGQGPVSKRLRPGSGGPENASERCKRIFLKQMASAEQRMGGKSGGLMASSGGAAAGGSKGAAGGKGQQQQPQGLLQQAKERERVAREAAEKERLREEVVAAYRAQKKGGQGSGATLDSLRKLVKRGQQATYTLG